MTRILTVASSPSQPSPGRDRPGPTGLPEGTPVAARARAATKIFGTGALAVTALDRIDLDLKAGALTAIMGPSGSGKSTLLHIMAGLDRLTEGSVYIGDTDLSQLDERRLTELRRDRIGFVFQSFNLVPMLTVDENVRLPLTLARRSPDTAWLDHVLERVGLTDRRLHRPAELSGGQRQRVAVARALASRPDIVFADEPTGALDRRAAADVLGLLRLAAVDGGQTIAMVTHDPGAAAYAERVVFLADGRVEADMADPTVESILDAMKQMEA
ncbi:MAG: ABC transporter ATP-binding protein [Acidimicrobiales bacterium]